MQEKVVSLDANYKKEFDYLLSSVKGEGLLYGKTHRGERLELYVAIENQAQDDYFFGLVEEVLLTAFKWRYFSPFVSDYIQNAEDKALLFALLDFDSKAERKFFKDRIFTQNELFLDAHYNFGINPIKRVWEGYVELIVDFYSHRPSFSEKIELIAYMITVNRRNREERAGRYYLFDSAEDKYLQKVFYYHEKIAIIPKDCENANKIVKKIFG